MQEAILEQFYDTHAAGLFRYLLVFVKCEADAHDLLQEVFIRLAREKDDVQSKGKAWGYRLAHNLAVDWLRRRDARGRWEEAASTAGPEIFDPPSGLEARELAGQLVKAMAGLPVEQRTVMQLKLWEELTFEEIAATQGISANTAASRYRYGLEKLRETLRPVYDELTAGH